MRPDKSFPVSVKRWKKTILFSYHNFLLELVHRLKAQCKKMAHTHKVLKSDLYF